MPDIQPFDWYRLFLGEQAGPLYLLEVGFRTAVMYVYALVFGRFVGKRGVGQISPFEFIVIIIISSAAGDAMFYPSVPLAHGIVVLTVVIVLHRLLAMLTGRSQQLENVVEGKPLRRQRRFPGRVLLSPCEKHAHPPGRFKERELDLADAAHPAQAQLHHEFVARDGSGTDRLLPSGRGERQDQGSRREHDLLTVVLGFGAPG